ncbi:coproporphyrinogen-III oxidase family protein [Salinibacter altiplanensis]|uniref:coproporphyrinogen-III oxidase family protein n=1 Tax=Salinibacter altiplanensis TaxID=1803181 RepID=UPI000C9F2760|nr:coproporphyrinogen III oxidase [Salinibacter altiplanensis]
MAGLYIHVPFREAPRPYDDAYTTCDPAPGASAYATALAQEISQYSDSLLADAKLRTLYVGGGRPSLCPPAALRPLVEALARTVDPSGLEEVTVELHPADASPAYLATLRRWGVPRLSVEGLSVAGTDPSGAGAAHSPNDLARTLQRIRGAGFDDVSVDLLFGDEGQSRTAWKASLHRAVMLDIPHLTLHEMTTGAPDKRADQLAFALSFLRAKGYEPYELTHFARPGHRSGHQEHVYAHGSVLGLGPGAESFWWPPRAAPSTARRWANVADLSTYVERLQNGVSPVAQTETLETSALAREYVLLRLRTQEGLNLNTLADRYDLALQARKPDTLGRLREQGLIHDDPDCVRLTDRGRLLTDAITRRLVRGI